MSRLSPVDDDDEVSFHPSTAYDGTSQLIRVGRKHYQIPRAILAMHSDVWDAMTSIEDDSGNEIILQDSEEAFTVFCEALMMPLRSCIFQENPNLKDILGVLTIANKYCATDIENHSRRIAINLTSPSTIRSHISPNLTAMQIFEIAIKVNCSEISESAWEVVMEQLRAKELSISSVLDCVDRVCDPELAGKVYYEILIQGSTEWSLDPLLSQSHKKALALGALQCTKALEEEIQRWSPAALDYPGHNCSSATYVTSKSGTMLVCDFRTRWVKTSTLACYKGRILAYDALRRLEVFEGTAREMAVDSQPIVESDLSLDCREVAISLTQRALDVQRTRLRYHFGFALPTPAPEPSELPTAPMPYDTPMPAHEPTTPMPYDTPMPAPEPTTPMPYDTPMPAPEPS